MQSGRLRHPLDLERLESTQDPVTGAMTESWVKVAREWASVAGVNGREFIQSDATQAETTYRITIRYREEIDPTWRLVDGSIMYGIEAILPDNQKRQMVLMCKTL